MQPNALVPYANDRASIFGDTYSGVVNPMTWRPYPYPSLHRGPYFGVRDNRMSYTPSTWRKVPFTGFGEVDVPKAKRAAAIGIGIGILAALTAGPPTDHDRVRRIAIVGGGAAALSAALYYWIA